MTILVKGKEEVQVPHAVDVDGWLVLGWKVKELLKATKE